MVQDEIQEFDKQELCVLIFVHLLHQYHTFQEMNILLDDLLLYTNEIHKHNNQLEIVLILYEHNEVIFVKKLYK